MQVFWTCLAAYIVGWFICNVFLYQLAKRARENTERQRRFCRMMAAEYYDLAHPDGELMPDKIDEMLKPTEDKSDVGQ